MHYEVDLRPQVLLWRLIGIPDTITQSQWFLMDLICSLCLMCAWFLHYQAAKREQSHVK